MDGRIRCALIGLSLLFAAAPAQAIEPKRTAQPPALVASLAFIEPDGARQPVVEVWSNGLVQATAVSGTRQEPVQSTVTDQLSAAELRELRQLLAGECQISTFSTSSIRETLQTASEQRQLTADIEGAAETEIGLLVGQRWHAVSCPAVSILTTRFPDITEVQNVATAQARLQNIAAVALVGGGGAADRQAAAATDKLRELHPEADEITRRDLKMVRVLENGNRFVQFQYAGTAGQESGGLVSLTQTPQGPTRVSVLESPAVVR